jgi:hypothetical protein
MTSLFENLPALEAAAQETGPLMDRLQRHGEETQRATEAVLEDIEERRSEVDALEKDVEAALAALAREAAAGRARVDQGIEEAAAASDALQQELRETQEELAAAGDAAERSLGSLAARMRSAGEEAGQEEDRSAAAVASLREGLEEAERTLQEAVAGAVTSGEALEMTVEQARERLAAAASGLRERLAAMLESARGRMGATLAEVESLCDGHAAQLREQGEATDVRCAEIAAAALTRMDDYVEALQEAWRPAFDELNLLREQVGAAQEAVEADGDLITETWTVVRGRTDQLLATVAAVKEAASRVGLAWP